MRNTHEYVHSSVRYRIDEGANGVESDWSKAFPHGLSFQPWIQAFYRKITPSTRTPTYKPATRKGPLYKWKLEDGHLNHDQPNGVPDGDAEPVKVSSKRDATICSSLC
jgi:hypothetical protein